MPFPTRPHRRHLTLGLGLACAGLLAAAAQAQTPAAPSAAAAAQVVSLSTSASVDVVPDWLTVTLQVSRDGADGQTVQSQLRQVLDAALRPARAAAEPGQLEVRTGSFSVQPRSGRDGRITGWIGTAELVLEGRDGVRVSALAARLPGMTVTGTGWSVSRALRERHESELTAQAVARFRQRADEVTRLFGQRAWSVREVNVMMQDEGGRPRPMMATRAAPEADAALPTEAGRSTLSATVQGTVTLER
jgi:predicted secreted protein